MLQKVHKESGKEAKACARTSALRLRLRTSKTAKKMIFFVVIK